MSALGSLPIKQVSTYYTRFSKLLFNIHKFNVFDEHFVLDILVDDGHARGMVAMNMMEGSLFKLMPMRL